MTTREAKTKPSQIITLIGADCREGVSFLPFFWSYLSGLQAVMTDADCSPRPSNIRSSNSNSHRQLLPETAKTENARRLLLPAKQQRTRAAVTEIAAAKAIIAGESIVVRWKETNLSPSQGSIGQRLKAEADRRYKFNNHRHEQRRQRRVSQSGFHNEKV